MEKINILHHKLTHEVYCPYELSLLLKEAGFNYQCDHYFDYTKKVIDGSYTNNIDSDNVACPTISVAKQWLRVDKKIPIQMVYSFVKDEWACCVDEKYYWGAGYNTVSAEGIVQCLNIILHKECQIKFV